MLSSPRRWLSRRSRCGKIPQLQGGLRSSFSINLRRATIDKRNTTASSRRQTIKIVLDVTRLVREGKLTPEQAEELKALASRDIGILAIDILMSFGAIAVAAGILALNPTFATGAAIGVALVVNGLAMSFSAGESWFLFGTAGTVLDVLSFPARRSAALSSYSANP